jgi:hypothetical protein
MATVRLMTTVLPHSVDPAADYHVSLFFTHRLVPDGPDQTLAAFSALANWPAALRSATIELHVDNQPSPLACTPLTDVLSDAAWQAAFPAHTPVTDFPHESTTGADWHSYPASAMAEHTLQAHYASVFSSPVTPPPVSRSRLADAVLGYLRGSRDELVSNMVARLDSYPRERDAYLRGVADKGRINATEARDGCGCEDDAEGTPEPDSPVHRILDRGPTDTSAIGGFDGALTALLDDLVHPKPPPDDGGGGPKEAPTPAPPVESMLRDAHATRLYYHRPEEQTEPTPQPVPGARPPRPSDIAPDFHALAAAAGNIPALARQLGFVLDLKVADPAPLATARTIRCEVTVPGVERLTGPATACVTEGSNFLADAGGSTQWTAGYLTVGTPEYRVLELDPDACGLKLEQHLRGTVRAFAAELNGDPGHHAPAAPRATGFAIAHLDRVQSVRERVAAAERANDAATSGSPVTAQPLRYSDLVRGLRVEGWDDATRRWHSLHDRLIDVETNGSVLLRAARDAGFLQTASLSRAPDHPENPYHLHEVLAGWDGWSLSAPRPGLNVVHDSGQGGSPGQELVDPAREARPGAFGVRAVAAAGTLPALRYGRRYAFRVLGVDLAGNNVVHATDAGQVADPDETTLRAATGHLQGLRDQAARRDSLGLLEQRRPTAAAGASPSGLVGRVHDAMAAIERAAKNLITRPHLDVTAAEFAGLHAPSGPPDTVTTPRLFLRWDPVSEPTIVPRRPFTTGESTNRVVIRTTRDGGSTSERHLLPPKTSQLEAELDGCFDQLMASGDPAARRRAYAIALKERGSLFSTEIQDLDDPARLVPQPGIVLETAPTADPAAAVTLADLRNPERQPAAGQYVRHDTDQLTLPYLPDPMARGVALVFYQAGADHHLSDRRVLQSVVLPYSGSWPTVEGLRLVVESAPELGATRRGNEVRVGLPPGEQVGVAISSTLDPEHLAKLGLWRYHAVHDPAVTEHDRQVLERAALDGWLWWLTPSVDLRLVNATPAPARPPMITSLTAPPRKPSIANAELDGLLDIHGPSTEAVELRAAWIDPVDDPASPAPTHLERSAIVARWSVGADEAVSLLAIEPQGTPSPGVPVRPVVHTLPDTRYRTVQYRLHGTSRYREFFNPSELPPPGDIPTAGNAVSVTHLNSAAPPPPIVHEVLPMFFWEEHREPHHPFAARRVRRSGVRVWLDRPWFTSGEGEMLAVVVHNDQSATVNRGVFSVWGRDPTLFGPGLPSATHLPLLPAWEEKALQLRLDPQPRPGRPHARVTEEDVVEGRVVDVVDLYLYQPEFHGERGRWFVDIRFDAADTIWPFLRLNLARYQPNSIDHQRAMSPVVATDFVQLLPERTATISRPDADSVRVTVSGSFASYLAEDAAAPVARVSTSRTVRASLQTRDPATTSDLAWTTVRQVDCDVEGVDPERYVATWSGALPLDTTTLNTPGLEPAVRVLVEERELLPTDPDAGATEPASIPRLVYADHLYL